MTLDLKKWQVVQVLLAWKGDVNSRDYDGETPLHLAVKLPGSYEYSPPLSRYRDSKDNIGIMEKKMETTI